MPVTRLNSARVSTAFVLLALLSACAAPPAAPIESTQPATEAPVSPAEETAYAAAETAAPPGGVGTPPGYPTEVIEHVVSDPLVIVLLAGLEQRGLTTELGDASRVEILRDAPGQAYRLGDGRLFLHVYADAPAAQTAAAAVETAMPLPLMDWVAPPHFFQCNHLIVLYLGIDAQALSALSELCAPPFFTTDLTPAAEPTAPAPLTTIEAALAWLIGLSEPDQPTSAPDVRRQVQLESGVALLYTYEAVQAEQPVRVTRFSYLDWRDPVWHPDGDHMDVIPAAAGLPPVQFLTGSYLVNGGPDTPELPDRITFAGGRVSDPAISQVRVSFSDQTQETVPIVDGAYLAVRVDVDRVLAIEALDGDGQVVIEFQANG